jgi:hypothetical protein
MMLARSALKTAARPTSRLLQSSRFRPRAAFTTSASRRQRDQQTNLKNEGNGPVQPIEPDAERIAVPLNPDVYSKLTPTLSNFTLRDKVAVITGYIHF